MRFCEAIGLRPADFDFEAGILEVARSVVKVSRQHHPQGKTFLVRDYTKNGQTRRLKLDQAVVELVREHIAEHGICEMEVIFPAELVVPPRRTKPLLTEEQLRTLGDCEPVDGRVYAHGTMGGYTQAKCRCAGCRQWAREYGRERMRVRRAVTPHTLRHAFITAALDAGVPLRDVQEAASHADPRTTIRYDRARGSLDRHATYIVAAYIAGAAR
jgi:integrase